MTITTEAPAIRRGPALALSTHAAQPETPGALTVMMSVEEARF